MLFSLTLTFQAHERVRLSAFHPMLVVRISWTSLEVKVGYIHRGENGNELPYGYLDNSIWRRGCTRKCYVLTPKRDSWLIKLTCKVCGMLGWSTTWEQLNSWAPPWVLKPKSPNHSGLLALQIECVTCPVFLTTYEPYGMTPVFHINQSPKMHKLSI